jgi:hypothetical protein
MTAKTRSSFSTTAPYEVSRRPVRSFRSLRWLNGGVHWISAVVLVYAFISNGETTGALINPLAMSGEVKLGLVVGLISLSGLSGCEARAQAAGDVSDRPFECRSPKSGG